MDSKKRSVFLNGFNSPKDPLFIFLKKKIVPLTHLTALKKKSVSQVELPLLSKILHIF